MRLYISCPTREGDLDQHFSHENHCLTSMDSGLSGTTVGYVEGVVIDGAVAAHMLKPDTA